MYQATFTDYQVHGRHITRTLSCPHNAHGAKISRDGLIIQATRADCALYGIHTLNSFTLFRSLLVSTSIMPDSVAEFPPLEGL